MILLQARAKKAISKEISTYGMRQQTTTAGIIAEAIMSLQFRPSSIPWSGT